MNKDTLTLRTIDALHNCVEMAQPDASQIDDLLLEIGKAIDSAKVKDASTMVLERLYEEVIWLKNDIISLNHEPSESLQ